jgi:large subunit ribosomal protein L10
VKREEKEVVVEELRADLATAPAVIVATSAGMSVNSVNALRTKLRKSGVKYRIVKNTLARLAMQGTEMEKLYPSLKGFTAIAYHAEDPVITAKLLTEVAKTNDKLVVIGGAMGSTNLDADAVKALATLPSLDELRGKLIGLIQAPATKIAQLTVAPASKLARVFNAYAEKDAA